MKRPADTITLSKEQKADIAAKIQDYVSENFDVEIGNLQAEIFLDFITKNIGVHYYNMAVADAMSFMVEKVDDLYLLMKDEG